MNRIEYLAPQNWTEALAMKSDCPHAAPLAGGTDLLLQMKEKRRSVSTLLSLKRVSEAHELIIEDEKLILGSALTAGQLATDARIRHDYTALAMGAGVIGSIQIRNMATVGGNLCNAAPSADTAPPLLVLDAQMVVANASASRIVPLASFFEGPGLISIGSDELLTNIIVPRMPTHSGSFYLRHTPRAWMDIAVVGVAAAITLNTDNTILDARLALGAVAPIPMRAKQAESVLQNRIPTGDILREAGEIAAQEAAPIDDLRASAEYRRHLVSVLTQRALRGAIANAKRNGEAKHEL